MLNRLQPVDHRVILDDSSILHIQVSAGNPWQQASNTTVYSEGIFVGYRAYDQYGLHPLFPFGHRLSYATFAYDNLRLSAEARSALTSA